MSGPLGNLPGMSYDPIRNRYFPTPKGPVINQTEEDTRPLPSSGPGPSSFSSRSNTGFTDTSFGSRALQRQYHAQNQNQHQNQYGNNLNPHTRSYIPPNSGSYGPGSSGRFRSNQPQNNLGQSSRYNQDSRTPLNSYSSGYQPQNRGNEQMRSIEQLTIPPPECFTGSQNMKRLRSGSSSSDVDKRDKLDRVGKLRKNRFGMRYNGLGVGEDRNLSAQDKILSNLELDVEHHACGCHGEIITTYKSFGDEAYYATTDHGKLIMHHKNGNTAVFSVCAQNLVGMHCDIPRLTMIAIAGGSEPHLHLFKRDPAMLDHVFMTQSELDLPRQEIYAVSSFDDICTLGGAKSLTTIKYTSSLHTVSRRLPSDALAVHQTSPDLVYVGQRSGNVSLEDLRTNSRTQNVVASTIKGKAVVGVKKLKDSAVPWGLVVSGMSHEMLLFDVRYGDKPLKVFEGHFNTFHTSVAIATSPDDKTLFSSTSDRRIKGWSVISGEPLQPTVVDKDDNPLNKVFEHRVSHLEINDELGLDAVVRGNLYRFSR